MSYESKFNDDEKAMDEDGLVHLAPSNMSNYATKLESMETSHVPRLVLRSKVAIVGDQTVGKSALTQMFHSGGHMFPKNYIMTTSVDFCVKEVHIPDTNASVELYLFDCAGQSIFNMREMNTKYWENTAFVMAVYDVSSRESFQSVQKWLQAVRSSRPSTGGGPLPGVLVANKIDLREGGINSRAVVDSQEGLNLAQQIGLEYFETSALTGNSVDRPFNYMASQFHQNYEST
eukprot:CAMPEP_0118640314 /NCGR_PEP_ID=MMETSP0785-20121206/4689_1 /TAXON_ID=91992 /ORGANISM="Bolidomonas pacifica, Strain CCMP 1866" /LENGTH=231 /DNA_ID=CAMNT_0006531697 /DNA_START=9 /DNA_END=700 /DNA_ORIENTATION=-